MAPYAAKSYSKTDMAKAVAVCLAAADAASLTETATRFGVPERTLRRRLQTCTAASNPGVPIAVPGKRRGPKPLLAPELETQLAQWITTQQASGLHVSRGDVITHAQRLLQASTVHTAAPVGLGWCNRFMARHPDLSLRGGGSAITRQASTALSPRSAAKASSMPATELQSPVPTPTSERQADDTGPRPRKYDQKHMSAAVAMCLSGCTMHEVLQRFPLLHERTIRRRVQRVHRGEVDRRRGPKPLLGGPPERELVHWIMQQQIGGTRVTKDDILKRANAAYCQLSGDPDNGEKRLKEGWLRRFKQRHPELSGRAPAVMREHLEEAQDAVCGVGEASNSYSHTC